MRVVFCRCVIRSLGMSLVTFGPAWAPELAMAVRVLRVSDRTREVALGGVWPVSVRVRLCGFARQVVLVVIDESSRVVDEPAADVRTFDLEMGVSEQAIDPSRMMLRFTGLSRDGNYNAEYRLLAIVIDKWGQPLASATSAPFKVMTGSAARRYESKEQDAPFATPLIDCPARMKWIY